MKSSPQILTYYWQLNIQIYKVIYYNQDERFLEIMIGLMFEIIMAYVHLFYLLPFSLKKTDLQLGHQNCSSQGKYHFILSLNF